MGMSDFDPTDGGGNWASGAASGAAMGASVGGPWGALVGGGIGLVSGAFSDLTGGAARRRRRAAEAAARERQQYYDNLGKQYRDVATDPATGQRADTLFQPMGREIDRGMYQAGSGVTRAMSSRNITGGYSMAGQQSVVQQAAEERARGRAAAFDQALSEGRQGIAGQAQISHPGDTFIEQMLKSAEGDAAAAAKNSEAFTSNAMKAGLGAWGRFAGTPNPSAEQGWGVGVQAPQMITPEEQALYDAARAAGEPWAYGHFNTTSR